MIFFIEPEKVVVTESCDRVFGGIVCDDVVVR